MQTALTDKYESDTLLQISKFRLLPCSRPKKKMINMKPVKTVQKAKKYKKNLQYSRELRQACAERNPRQTQISQKLTISVNAARWYLGKRNQVKYMSEAFF